MKLKKSIKNTIWAIISNGVAIILNLIAQTIFIKILDVEYLGLNGLFSNLISMLSIVELGLGSAIIYNLYKPIANNDEKNICALMNFYKKTYNIIILIILLMGLLVIPFLSFFVTDVTVDVNIVLVYLLFLSETICSYILSYNRSILYADQNNYIICVVHIIYLFAVNISQLSILYLTKNYYIYLALKIIFRLAENFLITYIAKKRYPYLSKFKNEKLNKDIENDIFKKIKALFFHKIGGFVVLGTDNIIISRFLGIVKVGLYSNYYMIINAVNTLFGQALCALIPSVGHLLVENNCEKNFNIFKKIRFLNFYIATFTATSILIIMQPFIEVWVGKQYILPMSVLYILVFNYFVRMMRNSYGIFKDAAGIFYEDRFIPIIESFLNIFFSVFLVNKMGLTGVFVGTLISELPIWLYSYPKLVYKKIFNRTYKNYFKETIGYGVSFMLISSITFLCSNLTISNLLLKLAYNIIVSFIVTNFLLILIFFKTENFQYYLKLAKKFIKK